jgi:hypothetical protein
MIATKYLHLLVLGLMVGGWDVPVSLRADIAIDESQSTASDSSGDSAAGSSTDETPRKSSHRKKKKSSTTTAGNSTNGAAAAQASSTEPAAKGAASPASRGLAEKTPVEPVPSVPASSDADATGAPPPVAKTTKKKKHAKSTTIASATMGGNGLTNAPPAIFTSSAPPAGATNSATGTSPTSLTAVAKNTKKKKHSKGTASTATATPPSTPVVAPAVTPPPATSPSHEPTIVVTPSSVPIPRQTAPVSVAPSASRASSPAVGFGPTVQTGLPVARPGTGTTATLPAGLPPNIRASQNSGATSTSTYLPSATAKFPFTNYPLTAPKKHTQTYPWKTNIITTVFWIGEGGSSVSSTDNYKSAWNADWIHQNGGSDDQDDMSGYASSLHASTLNPFYIALPFNDLVYPDKARRWIPSSWFKPPRNGKQVSACQHRWVEIKNRAGRTCFAQWEDVGPLRYDHAEYVFGPERPDTLTRAGLDVSPAVALYLSIDRHGAGITSWRFVDDDDVQPGLWLKYGEQAILFQAIKDQTRRGSTQRSFQDFSEPTPDGTSQDANQKKAGAARG